MISQPWLPIICRHLIDMQTVETHEKHMYNRARLDSKPWRKQCLFLRIAKKIKYTEVLGEIPCVLLQSLKIPVYILVASPDSEIWEESHTKADLLYGGLKPGDKLFEDEKQTFKDIGGCWHNYTIRILQKQSMSKSIGSKEN